jgi:hypothetical protein
MIRFWRVVEALIQVWQRSREWENDIRMRNIEIMFFIS